MDIQTNHTLKLLNAKCEYVCAVDNLSKKLDYGDDIECCLNKLYLASKLINRLECYCFPVPSIVTVSNGSETLSVDASFAPEGTYNLYSGDTIIATYVSSGEILYNFIISTLLESANIEFETYYNEELNLYIFTVTSTCGNDNLSVIEDDGRVPVYLNFTVVSATVCETVYSDCYNCIEDSNLREMYSVLDQLLS